MQQEWYLSQIFTATQAIYSMLIPDMSLKYENLCGYKKNIYVQIVLHINMH